MDNIKPLNTQQINNETHVERAVPDDVTICDDVTSGSVYGGGASLRGADILLLALQ